MILIKFFLGIFFLIIIVGVLGLGYLGLIPGLSGLFGSDKPRNLGVHFSAKDFNSAQTKLNQKFVQATSNPGAQFKSSLGNKVDTVLSQEEYTAHVEKIHPVSDMQVKFDGSTFEMSGRIDKSRIPQFARTWGITNASDAEILNVVNKYYPGDPIFYLKGTGGAKNNDLQINVTKAELGRLPVPQDQAAKAVELYTETLFNSVPGFYVEESSIDNGKLHFKGSTVNEVPMY